jgi:hypothetical protein
MILYASQAKGRGNRHAQLPPATPPKAFTRILTKGKPEALVALAKDWVAGNSATP